MKALMNNEWILAQPGKKNARPMLRGNPFTELAGKFRTRAAAQEAQDIAGEDLFNRMLCLERKRSERTGDPFLLMLLDFSELGNRISEGKITEICEAVDSGTRDTDVVGWYEHPVIIGIIGTALKNANRAAIRGALLEKTAEALSERLDPEDLRSVAISFHFFPDEIDNTDQSLKSDEKLYRDIKRLDKSRPVYTFAKRVLDMAGSLFGLLLFSPFFLIIPLLVKFTSEGPVLFKQRRIGRFGKEFNFLKFRTMHINNNPEIHQQYVASLIQQGNKPENAKGTFKITNDPRITSIGRFLRKTSLDELPQFINALRGEMSIVGPRPPIPYEVAKYSYWHRRRVIEVKPGITGLWQVEGRSRTTFDEMVRLDLRYVREQSIWLDLKIILKTPAVLISGAGAY